VNNNKTAWESGDGNITVFQANGKPDNYNVRLWDGLKWRFLFSGEKTAAVNFAKNVMIQIANQKINNYLNKK
jgi:hypothetical protein